MTEIQTQPSKKHSELIAQISLLAPIIGTCIAIAIYPTIIWSDPANNPTASSLILFGSFFIVYLTSAIGLTMYFVLSQRFRQHKKIIVIIFASSAVWVAFIGLISSSVNPGFPYYWTMPVYSSHCGYGLNSTFPSAFQCYSGQSGTDPNSIGIVLDIVLWLAIVELIMLGSSFATPNLKFKLSVWLWVLIASCYSSAILVNLFSIANNSFPPVGYPISPWKYLDLPICRKYPGSWCYGLQSNILLGDYFFWVAISLVFVLIASVALGRDQRFEKKSHRAESVNIRQTSNLYIKDTVTVFGNSKVLDGMGKERPRSTMRRTRENSRSPHLLPNW